MNSILSVDTLPKGVSMSWKWSFLYIVSSNFLKTFKKRKFRMERWKAGSFRRWHWSWVSKCFPSGICSIHCMISKWSWGGSTVEEFSQSSLHVPVSQTYMKGFNMVVTLVYIKVVPHLSDYNLLKVGNTCPWLFDNTKKSLSGEKHRCWRLWVFH
jgi:hypothetical protein